MLLRPSRVSNRDPGVMSVMRSRKDCERRRIRCARHRIRLFVLLFGLALAATLGACGSASSRHGTVPAQVANRAAGPVSAGRVVVRVGSTRITGETYDHWLTIGEATVQMPRAGRPAPTPVAYVPPRFTACVTRLRGASPSDGDAQLKDRCRRAYEAIQARILGFLITGDWLREEARERHVSVTPTAVQSRFEEERRSHYPKAVDFKRLQETTRQTVPDLEFAVKTEMLSGRLLDQFAKRTGREAASPKAVAAFNHAIVARWTPRTDCEAGYVVRDCRQYRR
jgi:hypothetical protein